MSDTIYDVEVEMMTKVREWAEGDPTLEFYYVSHVVIHDDMGSPCWRYYLGDEARFERVTAGE